MSVQYELLPPEAFTQEDWVSYCAAELIGDGFAWVFSSSTLKEKNREALNDAFYKRVYDRFIPQKHELKELKDEAKSGSIVSTLKLACYYLCGVEYLDVPTGVHWLEMAAQVGHPWSQFILARFLADEHAPWGDSLKACVWLFIAAASEFEAAVAIRDGMLEELSEDELASINKGMKEWYQSRKSVIMDENA